MKRGFTLIEMLIALGVWAIFATLTMVNVTRYKPIAEVEGAADIFYNQLVFAQNLASSGVVYADQFTPFGEKEVPNGYGVHIDTSAATASHWLYADLYDPGTSVGNVQYDVLVGGIPEKISSQSTALDTENIQVTITRDDPGYEGNSISTPSVPVPIDIFFETPAGTLQYFNTPVETDKIIVEFAYIKDTSILQRVFIERLANQIYFEIEN